MVWEMEGKGDASFQPPARFHPMQCCCLIFTVAVVFFNFENHAPSASVFLPPGRPSLLSNSIPYLGEILALKLI